MKFWRNRDNEKGKPKRKSLVVKLRSLNKPTDLLQLLYPVLDPRPMPGVQVPVELKATPPLNHTDHLEQVVAGALVPRHPIVQSPRLTVGLLEPMYPLAMLLPVTAHKLLRLPHQDDMSPLEGEVKKLLASIGIRVLG
jgi:hypothetical protein